MAALFFLPLIFIKNLSFPKDFKTLKILFIAALVNNVIPFSLIPWGQQYISSSTTAIVLAVGPFIALILSHFTTKDEKFTFMKFLGVGCGFFGIVILLADGLTKDISGFYGQIAVLLASFGYILSGILLRKVSYVSSLITSCTMFIFASIILFPFLLFSNSFDGINIFNESFYSLIFLALIPTAFASVLRIEIIQSVGVQFMSQVTYLIPLFTIFFAWLIFDEKADNIIYLSLFFVFLGLLIRNIKNR